MQRFLRVPMIAFSLLIALVGVSALAPAASASETVEVTGSVSNGDTFVGVVADARFDGEGALSFEGQLQVIVTVDGVEHEIDEVLDHQASILDSSDCEQADVAIEPIVIEELGIELQLDVFSFEQERGLLGGLLGGAICLIDELLNADNDDLAELLNDLLDQ